jgi:CHAT domain-containing protein/tetratricopeptide (TPR) repeat protein
MRWIAPILLLGLAPPAADSPPVPTAVTPLAAGDVVERELAGGEAHHYGIAIPAGRNLLLTVDQRDIDVILEALGPNGERLAVDAPNGRRGKETLLIAAAAPGEYRVTVRSPGVASPAGRYELRAAELPSGTAEQAARLAAEALMSEAGRGYAEGTAAARRAAVDAWREAAPRWRALGQTAEEARTLHLLARGLRRLGETRPALEAAQQALALYRRLGDRAGEAEALTAVGLFHWSLGENPPARAALEEARALSRQLADRRGEATAQNNLCLILHSQGELRQALPCYEEALSLFRTLGAPPEEAAVLNNIGGVHESLGEPLQALEPYRQALALYAAAGEPRGGAQVLLNLAAAHRGLGETGVALELYAQALAAYREIGDRAGEGRTLNNLGFAYSSLGELRRAVGYFEAALPLHRAAGDRRAEAATLSNLGRAHFQLGEIAAAEEHYRRALALARDVGDRRDEGAYLVLLGQAYRAAGDLARARATFDPAIALQREVGDRRGEASALHGSGEVHAAVGELDRAIADLSGALEIRGAIGDRTGEVETRVALSRLERRRGRAAAAWSQVERALAGIESLRREVDVPELRATFLASQQQAFELAIALQMDLHRREPEAGHHRLAFSLSERARARSLLELLHEARAEIREGVDPALRERERLLGHRLRANARRERDLPADAVEERRRDVERERQELLAEADRLAAEIRRQSPRYAELVQPQPLGAAEIQSLLDPETLLLEYALGEERSFLWALDAGGLAAFDLPPRAEIEAAALTLYRQQSARGEAPAEAASEAAAALARTLLGPVAGRLEGRRLVIVGDGALHYLPFAALPAPAAGAAGSVPLIARHEIVSLPSASVLGAQRGQGSGDGERAGGVAVFADPVFSPGDTRVRRADVPPAPPGSQAAPRTPPAAGGRRYQRLPWSRREAQAILALAPAGASFSALDFRASRATVFAEDLTRYALVHFATHGVIDAETPALSGLALSMVDEAGEPVEGFLSLGDLYNLRLDADLVVLSGCETALGRQVRGEGLVGLTRGFFYAGAERVLASLWPVEDRGTAELMSRLYREILSGGRPPAAALRAAQLALAADPRWQDPYHWAGFVLQGDWK